MTDNQNIDPSSLKDEPGSEKNRLDDKSQDPAASEEKQVEVPPGPSLPVETVSTQPTTEDQIMEVHHPHHLTHKKKWSEYLLEFLMLFFAVFLGFLAENFREHQIEESRAERHMHTMVENLKYDTTRYGVNLRSNLLTGKGLDSFRYEIDEALKGNTNANKLYYYLWKYGRSVSNPVTNNAAMSQLKSSGMLRMISNDSLLAEMGDYYERRHVAMERARDAVATRRDELNSTYGRVFSYRDFEELLQRDTVFQSNSNSLYFQNYYNGILNRDPPLALQSSNPELLEKLYQDIAALELALRNFNSFIRYANEGAVSLMRNIQKEYGDQ